MEVNDSYSNWRLVTIRVAQGSVLRPVLFDIFIEESEVIVYSCLEGTPNWEDQSVVLKERAAFQRDLNKLEEWTNRNLTKIKMDRCEALYMGRKSNNIG